MAKETKKTMSIVDMISNAEGNVSENLQNANQMEKEVQEMAENKMKEEEKKQKADELIRITKRAVYTNVRLVIESKYTKDTEKIMAEARNKSLELLNELKEGKLTPSAYEDALEKMVDEKIKEISKCGEQRRNDMKELNRSYVGSAQWEYRWENPFNRLNRAIENK